MVEPHVEPHKGEPDKTILEVVDAAAPLAPHSAEFAGDDDSGEPAPIDASLLEDVDWPLLEKCAEEPQNDIGNSRRLRHRFGDSLLHIQNVGHFAWDKRRWAEDTDLQKTRPMCHVTGELIKIEALVINPTPEEQISIDAGDRSAKELRAAEKRLAALGSRSKIDAEKVAMFDEIESEVQKLKLDIYAGKLAIGAVRARRTARRKFSVSSGNATKINGMLGEALSYMSKPVGDLDRDPLALNVANGTLRFQKLDPQKGRWDVVSAPHSRADYISKLADVEFDADANCPTFHEFLDKVLPDKLIRDFVQRYFGYCSTALTREQVFVLFHGEGRNGKSTLVDLVAKILADYSTSVPVSTLVNEGRGGKGSEATPDLARLPGARLVRCAEPREGLAFDESLIKGLTSGEPLPVRRLNQDFIDIYPTFKLIISANRKPTIKGNDDGIWRRVIMVPFDIQIAEGDVDKNLPAKLWDERSGILNWMLEGACNYLELGGLDAPDAVKEATQEYRDESDHVGRFIRAACEITGDPIDIIRPDQLYAAFTVFCKKENVTPFGSTTFTRRLTRAQKQFGFTKMKSSTTIYCGVKLRDGFVPEHGAHPQRHGDAD